MFEAPRKNIPLEGDKVIVDSINKRTGGEIETSREVHSAYYESLKQKHNAKWDTRIRRTFKTEAELAQEEADQDNLEFEARQSPEFKKGQENLKLVFDEIIRYMNGDRTVRPMLMVLGGAMKGIHCAAQLQAMEELGMKDAFHTMVGVSAGSGPMAYFATGETEKSIRLFNEQCTTKDFLDYSRGLRGMIDTDIIGRCMREEGVYQLDTEALKQSPANLVVLATTMNGEVRCIDLKTAYNNGLPNPVMALQGSAAIPLMEPDGREVNGEFVVDGSTGETPMGKIVDQYRPTSILILPNLSFSEHAQNEMSTPERILLALAELLHKEGSLGSMATDFISDLRKTLLMDNKRSLSEVDEYLSEKEQEQAIIEAIEREMGIKIGVLYPPRSQVSNLTNDPLTFATAELATYNDTYKQLRDIGIIPHAT